MTVLHRFAFGTKKPSSAVASDNRWKHLSDKDYRGSIERIKASAMLVRSTPVWAEDLLRVLRAVNLADRHVSRANSDDRWSREFEVGVEVSDADRWSSALPVLENLLMVLTDDNWHLSTNSGADPIDSRPRMMDVWVAEAVALFSGGLDSTCYAARHLAQSAGNLLLVSHDQANAHAPQEHLLQLLKKGLPPDRQVERRSMSSEVWTRGKRLESSTRTRGLSYIASAVFAAAAHQVQTVIVPENGQLAINPPISPARRGACSTRSVHPAVLSGINQVIDTVGGNVTLENPFLTETKGDVCRIGLEAGLSESDLAETVSCGSHTIQRRFGNCGYCFPCLIRRSGLLSAGEADLTKYGYEFDQIYSDPVRSQHLQDLRLWAAREFGARDLLADVALPPTVPLADALDVISRGRVEISRMLASFVSS